APFADDARDQIAIGDVAFVKGYVAGHGAAKTGDQIVDHRNRMARLGQRQHRMAADIAGAAGYQNGDVGWIHGMGCSFVKRNAAKPLMKRSNWMTEGHPSEGLM